MKKACSPAKEGLLMEVVCHQAPMSDVRLNMQTGAS